MWPFYCDYSIVVGMFVTQTVSEFAAEERNGVQDCCKNGQKDDDRFTHN
jgi:hypothetical protein